MSGVLNLLAVSSVFMTQSIFFELSESFKIDIGAARYSFSIVSLFYAIAFIFVGPITDRYNLPRISLTGLILLSAMILCASFMDSYRLFIGAMAFIGIFAAFIPASMFPHIAKTAPKEQIGIYMGSIVASGTLGVIFGRVTMGILTSIIGWQFSFKIISFIFFILSILTYLSLVEKEDKMSKNPSKLRELYANSIQLLFDLKVLTLLFAGFSLFVGFLGMVTFLTYRLIGEPFFYSSGEVGWISFAGITALIAPFAGNISQKTGPKKILFGSLLLCLLSLQLMGWFDSVLLIVLGLLLLFLGVYMFQPILFILVGQNAAEESIGSVSSLYILFCIGGGSLSSFFLGPVWHSYGWYGVTVACSISLVISLSIISVNTVKK
jgi:YNFM family putative membrane transporter